MAKLCSRHKTAKHGAYTKMQQHCDDDPILKQLGDRIRTIREELHLSQGECANICQIARSHMCHLERGSSNASVLLLAKVAQGLGIELVDLFKP